MICTSNGGEIICLSCLQSLVSVSVHTTSKRRRLQVRLHECHHRHHHHHYHQVMLQLMFNKYSITQTHICAVRKCKCVFVCVHAASLTLCECNASSEGHDYACKSGRRRRTGCCHWQCCHCCCCYCQNSRRLRVITHTDRKCSSSSSCFVGVSVQCPNITTSTHHHTPGQDDQLQEEP